MSPLAVLGSTAAPGAVGADVDAADPWAERSMGLKNLR